MLIRLVYASTSGNVEAVMEKIAEVLKAAGHTTELYRAEKTAIDTLTSHDTFILGTSTWEHGELNPYFQQLLQEIKKTDMSGKKAAFVGLGDTRYEPVLFAQGIEIVKAAWEKSGGQAVSTTLKINGEPYHLLETVVTEWANTIAKEYTS